MSLSHDIYFGNLTEDNVGEPYLFLPSKVFSFACVYCRVFDLAKEKPMDCILADEILTRIRIRRRR